MRFFVRLISAGIFVLAVSPLAAQTPVRSDAVQDINTMGRGEVRVTPDRASVFISVETHASSAAAASSSNSQITNATIKAVKESAGPKDIVTTQSFSVTPDYEKSKPKGYGARNTIKVELMDIARLGPVIDASLTAGATQVSQVQFSSSTAQDARRRALRLAVNEARSDAEALAEAAGGSVGRLLSVTSGMSPVSPWQLQGAIMTASLRASAMGEPPPIMPDDLTVYAIANSRWEFVPRKNP